MNNKYKRHNPNGQPFMSVPVFIEWFFAWASHMFIDFRQQCFGCEGRSKILACDGTGLGIGFKKTFVKPVETPELEEVPKTTLRRFSRSFIFNTNDKEPSYFQDLRKKLNECCSLILKENLSSAVIDMAHDILPKLPPRSHWAYNILYDP